MATSTRRSRKWPIFKMPRFARSSSSTSSQQRVLALVTDAYGGYGGIAQYNRDLFFALSEISETIEIDVLPRLAPCQLETIPRKVTQHPPVRGRLAYGASALAFALRRRPTVIFNGHLYHGPLASYIARLTGAKLVTQVHGTEIWGDVSRERRRSLEFSDLVLTVSRDTRARVLAKTDVEPEKVVVLNNTVSADFTPGDRLASRKRFGLTDELAIVTVARLDVREGYKGHDRVIPLLGQLISLGRSVCYLIAGVGNDQPRLKRLAKSSGVDSYVRFLGKVPREHLPDLYRAADLFALPSAGEGFGIAFLEAMACGTRAIGLAVGGAPDALGDGQLGVCVPPKQFEEALLRLATATPPARQPLSAAVHDRFGQSSFKSQCNHLMRLVCQNAFDR
jgi:phosphatidylinositol alpha-1,6-mannosyltransferase